ncbi:TraR/DksA C4-type zinc finger protein [Ectothiorhodospiraceae bacterium 2226]|nr:TraR/DksA C4-type zinc finger protein [Ectothiorhodospiraceae bacterium 2226]
MPQPPNLEHLLERLRRQAADEGAEEALPAPSTAMPEQELTCTGRVADLDTVQLQHAQAAHSRRLAERARHALHRHALGRYGECEGCGEAIEPARLEADPAATTCTACAREAERRMRRGRAH